MYYEFFIDVFFLTNAVMDYLLLRMVNRLLRCSATHIRSIAGGVLGALAVSLMTILQLSGRQFLNTILVHVVINTMMVKFGCKIKGWNLLIRGVMLLYLTSFIMGGLMIQIRRRMQISTFPAFLFLAAASYLCVTAAVQGYNRLKKEKKTFYEIVLYAGGKCIEVRGLYDTGNRLNDPYSGKPVSIVKEYAIRDLLKDCEISRLMPHYLSFSAIGGKAGVLMAVTLDYLTIKNEKDSQTVKNPVVALDKEEGNFAGNCQLILNSGLIDS